MADVICVDGKFSKDALDVYAKYGIVTPVENSIYTVRDVIINSIGKTGILLEEIVNPKLPEVHSIGMVGSMEPNWNIDRFRTLSGELLNISQIKKQIYV